MINLKDIQILIDQGCKTIVLSKGMKNKMVTSE